MNPKTGIVFHPNLCNCKVRTLLSRRRSYATSWTYSFKNASCHARESNLAKVPRFGPTFHPKIRQLGNRTEEKTCRTSAAARRGVWFIYTKYTHQINRWFHIIRFYMQLYSYWLSGSIKAFYLKQRIPQNKQMIPFSNLPLNSGTYTPGVQGWEIQWFDVHTCEVPFKKKDS